MDLCDTNVISELARPRPNPGVLNWASTVTSIALSAVVVEEIYYGLSWKPNPRVSAWFDRFLTADRQILPVTREIAQRCGEMRGQFMAGGIVRSQADMLIAATAQIHQLTIVTRNVRDFEGCTVPLLNPFS